MANFLDEMAKFFDMPINSVMTGFKLVLLNDSHCILQGRLRLLKLSETEVFFKTGARYIKVFGKDLQLHTLEKSFVALTGCIQKLENGGEL